MANTEQFTFNKALEECTEFMENLLKYQTKKDTNPKRPTREDILEEFAHLMFRGSFAIAKLFSELDYDDVGEKILEKAGEKEEQLLKWLEEGKYKGGL